MRDLQKKIIAYEQVAPKIDAKKKLDVQLIS